MQFIGCRYYYILWETLNCRPRKDNMIPFPFNENKFSFFVSDHLLVGQLYTNPKSDRSLLSCLKVTECSTSEIGDAPLYNSSSLPIQVRTIGPLPAQNANPDGSTLEGTAQRIGRPFRGGGAEEHRQEDLNQGVHRKGPGNHWWNSPAAYSADCQRFRHLIHNCECMCEGGLEVQVLLAQDKPDLDWEDKEPQANQVRQAPLPPDLNPLDYFVWSYVENITNMTYHNTKASLIAAIRRVFTELPPALAEKACSQFRIRIEVVIEAEGGYIE